MSSSCLSSGAYHRLEALDLDIMKSPSSTSWISNSSSPSSTISDSSNCGRAISTRKPRTPRKRPNQTYNEAAAILSTAYPKIFPTASNKFPNYNTFLFEPSDLLMPFHQVDDILESRLLPLPAPAKFEGVVSQPCQSPPPDEFDAESILDEEIGGGIESIIGNLEMEKEECDEPPPPPKFCYGYPVGLGVGYGLRRAMRSGDDWWRFPCVNVDVVDVNPNAETKKKKKVEIKKAEEAEAEAGGLQLQLNLNYEGVLRAWSDKPSPFSGDSEVRGRLAQIDLFGESGGVREASVLRYKEKRRTRLFSKKIRYQVRKLNADRRPRMKGRFVRTPTSSDD